MQFQEQTPLLRFEWSMRRSGRAAGICRGAEFPAALPGLVAADDEIARDQVHLLPVLVHEGLGGVHAGRKTQMPSAESAPALLVQKTSEHLLLDSVRIAGQLLLATAEVDLVELLVLFLDRHFSLLPLPCFAQGESGIEFGSL